MIVVLVIIATSWITSSRADFLSKSRYGGFGNRRSQKECLMSARIYTRELIEEINFLRIAPAAYAEILRGFLELYEDDCVPGLKRRKIRTNEGSRGTYLLRKYETLHLSSCM